MAKKRSRIIKTPKTCGGSARVDGTRITVEELVYRWEQQGQKDWEIREDLPDLDQADLDAAWRYHLDHPEEVE